MAADVPLIDLDAAPPPPSAEQDTERLRVAISRPVLILAMAVLSLAAIGPAGPPEHGLRLVLSAGGTAAAAFTLGAGSLYTASYGVNSPHGESAVHRYDLTDGSLRWAADLPQGVQGLVIDDGAGVLMARSGADPRISFLDAGTGRVLWRSEEANTSVITLTSAGALLTTDVPGATALRLADAHTGRTLWKRTLDQRVILGPRDLWWSEPSRIVAISFGGTALTLDFATGAVLSRGDLGGDVGRPIEADGDGAVVSIVGGNRLVVQRQAAGALSITAYSLTPFARLWQRTDGPVGDIVDCGPVWCVSPVPPNAGPGPGPDRVAVDAVDPADGAVRWRAPGLSYAARFNDRVLIAEDTWDDPETSLLDPATGRVVHRLGKVVRVGDVLLRRDTKVSGRAWVFRLDAGGSVQVVGAADTAVLYGCAQHDRHLACPTTAGPTKVWRLP